MTRSASFDVAPLLPRAAYVRDLRGELPDGVFARATSRLAFVPVHLAVIVMSTIAIAASWVPWFTVPLLSLAIGASFAGLTFIAHEGMHGAIVRGRRAQHFLGFLGFLPFLVSPTLWNAWHNSDHHARANLPDDPDAYPTIERYHAEAGARFAVDAFSLGGSRWRGGLSLILGFTVQSAAQLIGAQRSGILTREQHRRAKLEAGIAVAFWLTVGVLVGFVPFLFVYVLPLLVANVCVMAFILTNHSLSPRVSVNDPLASGLTVTTPRLVHWLTLGFGYHVEHHLYPSMSGRHAGAVRTLLQERYPGRYQSMPLTGALLRLHRSGRVYKSDTTLFDPRSGSEHATL
jgi:fatty acid desaturase